MSGVKNLRAMFEQKGDNLPDRGRSPGPGGLATPSPSASPRPLSKVRTSFVAIEKDGRIGLRRDPSQDSVSVSSRRLSNDTDTTNPQPISERSDVFSDNMASTFKTNLSYEVIPESPSQDTPVKLSSKKENKSLQPNANPDKVTDREEPQTKMLSSNPTESSAARLGGTVFNEGISDALNGTASTTTKPKAPNTTKPAPKTVAPVSTAKTATKPSKSPLAAKAPSGKEPTKAASSSANPPKTTTTKTAAPKPAPIHLPPSSTGFVKPKPKSPTRPVKLPSSLTTHTAASAQKVGSSAAPAPRQSLSRASGNAQHLSANPTTHRSPSRNSVSTTGTTTAKTLKHKPSNANVGRSRPSLGVPPKPAAKEQPAAKRESHVDEGFLARMMRPTQSSAKKTSEKAPVTPPRRQSAPIKKLETRDVENAKKATAKIQASSTQAKTVKAVKNEVKPVATKGQPIAKEIVPAVAQAETAEAAIESAKLSTDTDTVEAPSAGEEEAEAELPIEDVATVVAQSETAEDIIETAKTSEESTVVADIPSTEEVEVAETEPVSEPTASVEADEAMSVVSLPSISEDPLKVEDIEDTVQEIEEPSHPVQSIDTASDISEAEDGTKTKESPSVTSEEVSVVKDTVDEPSKPEETVVDVEETVTDVTPTVTDVEQTAVDVTPTAVDVKLAAADVKPTTADVKVDVEKAGEEAKPDDATPVDVPNGKTTEDRIEAIKDATDVAL